MAVNVLIIKDPSRRCKCTLSSCEVLMLLDFPHNRKLSTNSKKFQIYNFTKIRQVEVAPFLDRRAVKRMDKHDDMANIRFTQMPCHLASKRAKAPLM